MSNTYISYFLILYCKKEELLSAVLDIVLYFMFGCCNPIQVQFNIIGKIGGKTRLRFCSCKSKITKATSFHAFTWGVGCYRIYESKDQAQVLLCFKVGGGAKVTELTNFSLYKASTFFVLFVCTVCDNFPEGRFFYAYGYINLFLFSCQLHLNGGGEKDRRPPPLCTPMSLSKVPLREK